MLSDTFLDDATGMLLKKYTEYSNFIIAPNTWSLLMPYVRPGELSSCLRLLYMIGIKVKCIAILYEYFGLALGYKKFYINKIN